MFPGYDFEVINDYLFENVLVSWKARRYRVCGGWCCIPESYGKLLIAAHNYQSHFQRKDNHYE